jgi:hypothetical protein
MSATELSSSPLVSVSSFAYCILYRLQINWGYKKNNLDKVRATGGKININKHLKKVLQGTVLPVTLIGGSCCIHTNLILLYFISLV